MSAPTTETSTPPDGYGKSDRVLVTYAWVRSSWAIIRALGRAGLRVYAGDSQEVFMSRYSRYCAGWVRYPDYAKDPEGFIRTVGDYIEANSIGTYLPSHEEGFVVARYRDRFPKVRIPISSIDVIERLHHKGKCADLLEELDIPRPWTARIRSHEELEAQLPECPKRGVLKSADSHGSHGVRFFGSHDQLRTEWGNLLKAAGSEVPYEAVVQEYVTGTIHAVSLLASEGRTVATFIRKNLREKEPFGGACVRCESVHAEPGLVLARRLVEHLAYTGVAMFEFIVTPDGRWLLMEVNPRYWGTTSHDIDCGVSFPLLHYRCANGLDPGPSPAYEDGLVSRWLAGDVIGFLKRMKAGWKFGPTLREFLGRDDFIMDFKLDDPVPFLVQSWLYFKHHRAVLRVVESPPFLGPNIPA